MLLTILVLALYGSFKIASPILFAALILNTVLRKIQLASIIIRVIALLILIRYSAYYFHGDFTDVIDILITFISLLGLFLPYYFYIHIEKKLNNAVKQTELND